MLLKERDDTEINILIWFYCMKNKSHNERKGKAQKEHTHQKYLLWHKIVAVE